MMERIYCIGIKLPCDKKTVNRFAVTYLFCPEYMSRDWFAFRCKLATSTHERHFADKLEVIVVEREVGISTFGMMDRIDVLVDSKAASLAN